MRQVPWLAGQHGKGARRSVSSTLVAALVVCNVAFSVMVVGHVVQRSERSKFRYSYWRIRDELVDALRDGRLQEHPCLREYIERTELLIDATDILTPFQLRSALRIERRAGWKPTEKKSAYLGATEEERAFLETLGRRALTARVRVICLGSPSGWILSLCFPIVAIFARGAVGRASSDSRSRSETIWQTTALCMRVRYGAITEIVRPLMQRKYGNRRGPNRPAYV